MRVLFNPEIYFNEAPIAMLVVDMTGHVIVCNQKFKELAKIKTTRKKIRWNDLFEFPPSQPKFTSIKKEETINNVRIKGNIKSYFSISLRKILNNRLVCSVILTNGNGKKSVINELRETTKKLRLFVEQAPAAVAMFDADMNYISCSQKWVDDWLSIYKKISKKNIIGKNHYELFEDVTEEWKNAHRKAMQGETLSNDRDYFINSEGGKVWLKWEARPWYLNKNEIGGIMLFTVIITNIIETELALKSSEEFNRRLVEYSPIAIIIQDSEGKIVFVNKSATQLIGAKSAKQLIGKYSLEYIIAEQHEIVINRAKKILKTGKAAPKYEMKYVRLDGAIKIGESIDIPFEYNRKSAILSVVNDITEIRESSDKLKANEAHLRQIIDLVPHHIFAKDGKGNILLANRAFAEFWNTTPEYIEKHHNIPKSSQPDHKLIDKYDSDDLEVINKQNPKSTPIETITSPKGNTVYFQTTRVPYIGDSKSAIEVLGIAADISERIKYEEDLSKSEKRLELFFQQSLDGFYIMEIDEPIVWNDIVDKQKQLKRLFEELRIVKINDAMLNQYGATSDQMMGYTMNDFFDHNIENGYSVFMELLNVGHQEIITEERKLDGSSIWIEGDYVCLYNNNAEMTGIFGIQRDITQRIKDEKDLEYLTEDLVKSNNELQQFAYITSHDLRAPVVNLKTLISFYNKKLIPKENYELFNKIEESINRLDQTLNDLVDIVAINKSRGEKNVKVSFREITDKVIKSIEEEVKSRKAIIKTDFSKVKSIIYPTTHINSILQNLITNAMKYQKPKTPPEVNVSVYRDNDFVCIEVADNGLGIDLKKFGDKLFGMYQKFHSVPNSKGLGLYILKSQVESLGGHIEVTSTVRKGSKFFVYIKPQ